MDPTTAATFKFSSTFLGCSLEFERSGPNKKTIKKPKLSDEKLKELQLVLQKRKDKESKALSQQLKSPVTLGAKALAASSNKPQTTKSKQIVINEGNSAKDVLQLYGNKNVIASQKPVLGKGHKPGDYIELVKNSAKRKAIDKLRRLDSSGIVKVDPNATRKRMKLGEILKKVEANIKEDADPKYTEIDAKRRRQEAINAILSRKSKHENEVSAAEMEAEKKYFKKLEEKEKKEERMRNVTETKCKVIICKDCRYTAHSVADRCVQECHNYFSANAVKRFFKCKKCKHKTYTFNEIIPTKPCGNCNDFDFEKTSMYHIKEVKQEKLLIRGEEEKFFS